MADTNATYGYQAYGARESAGWDNFSQKWGGVGSVSASTRQQENVGYFYEPSLNSGGTGASCDISDFSCSKCRDCVTGSIIIFVGLFVIGCVLQFVYAINTWWSQSKLVIIGIGQYVLILSMKIIIIFGVYLAIFYKISIYFKGRTSIYNCKGRVYIFLVVFLCLFLTIPPLWYFMYSQDQARDLAIHSKGGYFMKTKQDGFTLYPSTYSSDDQFIFIWEPSQLPLWGYQWGIAVWYIGKKTEIVFYPGNKVCHILYDKKGSVYTVQGPIRDVLVLCTAYDCMTNCTMYIQKIHLQQQYILQPLPSWIKVGYSNEVFFPNSQNGWSIPPAVFYLGFFFSVSAISFIYYFVVGI